MALTILFLQKSIIISKAEKHQRAFFNLHLLFIFINFDYKY